MHIPNPRHVSINTAINSGIRQSRSARDGPRSRQFDDNGLQRTWRGAGQDQVRRTREPRPNHARRQDFGDAQESAIRALASPNVRQRAYLRGGRPEESDQRRGQTSPKSSRSSFEGRPRVRHNDGVRGTEMGSTDRRPSSFRSRHEFDPPPSIKSKLSSEAVSHSRSPRGGQSSTVSSADQLEGMFGKDRTSRTRPLRISGRDRYESRESRPPEEVRASRNQRAPESGRSLRSERLQSRYDDDSKVISPKLKRNDDPVSIPYTTPASEFLYGTSVVTAALKASRRKLYKLYIYEGENRERTQQDNIMIRLARSVNVPVQSLSGDGIRMMDKMSLGRPHNVSPKLSLRYLQLLKYLQGYILESSPLPKAPATTLQAQASPSDAFGFTPDHQSREEAAVNGDQNSLPNTSGKDRYPLVILIDGVVSAVSAFGFSLLMNIVGSWQSWSYSSNIPFSRSLCRVSTHSYDGSTIRCSPQSFSWLIRIYSSPDY